MPPHPQWCWPAERTDQAYCGSVGESTSPEYQYTYLRWAAERLARQGSSRSCDPVQTRCLHARRGGARGSAEFLLMR